MVAAAGPLAGAATTSSDLRAMPFAPLYSVRRAGLADVAGVARLSVLANREADAELPSLKSATELCAPEIALRLLDHLDDGDALYVAERDRGVVGFAHVSGLMVGDGGHLVELKRVYVTPELRRRGLGRQLLRLIQRDLYRRPNPPALRAWAGVGSIAEQFLRAAGATAIRQRWKVGSGEIAVRGVVYGWGSRQVHTARAAVVRKRAFA